MYALTKKHVHDILEKTSPRHPFRTTVDSILIVLILLNILALCLETIDSIYLQFRETFYWFDHVSMIIFSIEYLLRLWGSTEDPRFKRRIWGRLKFAATPLAVFDFIAILPLFLAAPVDLRFLRAFRLLRLFRVLKLFRYSDSLNTFLRVMLRTRGELVAVLFVEGILLLMASSFLYLAENAAQPEVFSSIPAAMWWGVATLSTVGYGDIYPVTTLGRAVATFVIALGVGLFAVPAGILAAAFSEELKQNKSSLKCAHCGKNPHK